MLKLVQQIEEATGFLRTRWPHEARVGIILGTGLGSVAEQIQRAGQDRLRLDPALPAFDGDQPYRPAGVRPARRRDRWSPWKAGSTPTKATRYQQITFPVRVMQALGARAADRLECLRRHEPATIAAGDIMVIEDHINLMGGNPLIGINDDRLGPRFPDMCRPYDAELIERALEIARRENFVAHRGVYVAVTGPNLETRAEYRFLRMIGADVVGMSTVPEVIVAVHAGLRVLGLSIVTDMCLPDALEPANIDTILATAAGAEPKLRQIVMGVLAGL